MARRKALSGLSLALFYALALYALAPALSLASGGTTAFTCDSSATTKDFSDAHCDTPSVGAGSFGHTALGEEVEVVAMNNNTGTESASWILKGTIAGIATEFTCGTASTTGANPLKNNAGPPMTVTGSMNIQLGDCALLKPESQVSNCTVTVGTIKSKFESTKMGVKFIPAESGVFASVGLANATGKTCKPLAGTYNIEGSATAAGSRAPDPCNEPASSGATFKFTAAETKTTLTFGGNVGELTGSLTIRKAPTGGVEQKPITFTTE